MQEQIIKMLGSWNGSIQVGDSEYTSVEEYTRLISSNKAILDLNHIKLYPRGFKPLKSPNNADKTEIREQAAPQAGPLYRIFVKQYMTEPSSPGFDFMAKWNNDTPMPLRVMTGTIEKETAGMYKMHLVGMAEATCKCMRCGRTLTNPISKKYGIGPECMQKVGFIGIDIEDVTTIKERLEQVEWTGWVIKSAILEKEEISE